jgi:predicted RND superfamily exporter protein
MSNWKTWLESHFVRLSELIMSHPKRFMLVFVLVLLSMGQFMRNVEFDSELENFIDERTDVRQIYNQVKETFGRNDAVMLAAQGDVLSIDFLNDLQELHERIESEIPFIEDVTSLVNAPYQKGTDDSLIVEDLLDEIPTDDASLARLAERIETSTLASSVLVNDNRSMALVMIELAVFNYSALGEAIDPFDDGGFDDAFAEDLFSENAAVSDESDVPIVTMFDTIEMMEQLKVLMAEYPDLQLVVAGMPAMNISLMNTMQTEMLFFIRLTVGLIILTLIAFFRQLNGVAGPMIAVLAALLLTMSTLVAFGGKISMPLVMLPSFLLAITIGDAVHLLTHFYRKIQEGEARFDAMRHAVQRTSVPMLLTSLTTAAGLLSLSVAEVIPIRYLGLLAGYGVIIAFVLTVTLIPALVMLMPMRKVNENSSHTAVSGWVKKLGELSWRHSGKLSLVWLIAVMLSFTQIVKLEFSHDPLNWMPEGLDIVESTRLIDRELSGTMTTDIVFRTMGENGVKKLEFLTALEAWQTELDGYKKGVVEVKGSTSIVDLIKESNRALQGGGEEHFGLPDSQSLVNEEIFLFENSASDQLYQMVDPDFQETKLTLVLPWNDLMHYDEFILGLQAEGNARFDGIADVKVTGLTALLAGTMVKLVTSMAGSYVLATGVIAVMMMALLSSVRLGLLAMVPNIAPIIVVMGLMIPFGIELDMLTMLVATIAIGVAVDNTVHFTHHFRHGLEQGHDVRTSMNDAFLGAGQALLTTSIVLSIGFYVFLFSDVHSIFNLGFLCGTAFILAMVSNFTLTPFLLRWYFRNHDKETEHPHSQTV